MNASDPPADPAMTRPRLRLRQAVLAAADLKATARRLHDELALGEPFADPGVEYFGLRNAVFALGDTFFEVVSPLRDGTAAGRLLQRRGNDCGYMLMFQVDDLAAARARAAAAGIREVFEVSFDDMNEVHLHPADMRGAIVSLSAPAPPGAWRWGGPDWEQRSAAGPAVVGAVVAVHGAAEVCARWTDVLGGAPPGVRFVEEADDRGLIEVALSGFSARPELNLGALRFRFTR